MARKVFISVLGTGNYKKCYYVAQNFKSMETRFIQQATLKRLTDKGDWSGKDEALILLTKDSKTDNWIVENHRRKNNFTGAIIPEEYIGLQEELESMNLPMPINPLDIPDGKNEQEIWDIFDILYNKALQEGDELYFDVTHGFRYLPMLVLVLGKYAHQLKHTEVKSITYGNWETRNKHTNEAPIIDITPLATLQDWTVAVHDYLEHGDATLLKTCSEKPLVPILSKSKGKDETAKALNKLIRRITSFCENLRYNHGKNIINANDVDSIKNVISDVDCSQIKPLKPLLGEINESIEEFKPSNSANMLYAAKLCYEHHNYPSAITLLQEGIISVLCDRYGLNKEEENQRVLIDCALFRKCPPKKDKATDDINKKNKSPKDKASNKIDKEKKIEEILTDEIFSESFAKSIIDLKNIRNSINHAAMKANAVKVSNIEPSIKKHIDRFLAELPVFESNYQPSSPTPRPRLLINLSNHEFSKWSAEQQEATKEYGPCEDMAFPAISPDMDSEAIEKLADGYIQKIVEKNKAYQVTVHLMGEMAFTHYAVSQLLRLGIPCICSTTARIVIEEADGTKTAQFRFARFRSYTN